MADEKTNKIITTLLILVISIAAITLLYFNLPSDQEDMDNANGDDNDTPPIDDDDDEQPPATIILTATYDEEIFSYTLEDLEKLDPITGYGGYRTSFPAIRGQGTYTGMPITELVENIAGEISNYSIIVTSNEGGNIENITYDYTTIQGNINTYNATNASDDTPIDRGNLTMILGYKNDGEYLDPDEDGNIRICFINREEEKITTASLWWKFVVSIEIVEE